MSDLSTFIIRNKIRQSMRSRRQKLSQEQQDTFAYQAATRLMQWKPLISAHTVALFLSFDGELDTKPLIKQLWNLKKKIYLPVLHPFNSTHILFLYYHQHSKLVQNRFKIYEPKFDFRNILSLNALEILIVPLVAFDMNGKRLGMGGGFYDRILYNWKQKKMQPVGYAHDFQLINIFPEEKWDISLPTIATPSKLWCW